LPVQKQAPLAPQQIAELQRHVGYGATWLGPVLVAGQGSRVTDIDGKSYIDCTAQAWTLALGYNHPEVTEAALVQMRSLPHVRAGFPTLPRLQLARRLADLCPGRLNIVTYAPTGSLGIESAMKLAMINRPAAHRFVTFYHAYHGNTLATMAASWSPTRTSGAYGPGVKFMPFMQNFVRGRGGDGAGRAGRLPEGNLPRPLTRARGRCWPAWPHAVGAGRPWPPPAHGKLPDAASSRGSKESLRHPVGNGV
jgi:4-aminobutyrate aminotransferase-like enzyme